MARPYSTARIMGANLIIVRIWGALSCQAIPYRCWNRWKFREELYRRVRRMRESLLVGLKFQTVPLSFPAFHPVFGCLKDSRVMTLLTGAIFSLSYREWSLAAFPMSSFREARMGGISHVSMRASRPRSCRECRHRSCGRRTDPRTVGRVGESPGRGLERSGASGDVVPIVVGVGLIGLSICMNPFLISTMDHRSPMASTPRLVLFSVGSDLVRVALPVLFPSTVLFPVW